MIIGGSACTDNDTGDMKESKELSLQILPTVSNLVVKNRGPVGEKTLKEGTIGLSIFSKDGYSTTNGIEGSSLYEPVPEYKRMQIQIEEANKYTYTPEGFTEALPAIYLKKNAGPVDIYAYHPATTTGKTEYLDKIPFTLGSEKRNNFDYMIAAGGKYTVDPMDAANKDKSTCTVPLEFRHIMAQLEFRVTPSFWGQDLLPTFIISTKAADNTPLQKIATKGSYSFFDGSMEYTTLDSKFSFTGDFINATTNLYTTIQGFVIPPIEWKDGEPEIYLSIEIQFNTKPSPVQTESYTFNLKELSAIDGTTTRYGLLPGYKYVINATIDNFVKYSGIPYKVEWTDVPMDFPI